MASKIQKGQIRRGGAKIPEPNIIQLSLVCFSFKYLDLDHEKFHLPDTKEKASYLATLFDRLKHISSMTFAEFRTAGKALRSHAIQWETTSEPYGYLRLPAQMQECQPWQFSLSREELGRIHGFLLSDIFYVIWVDHGHQLYPKFNQ
ncbi:MAG: hypothetical protein Q8R74_09820 [Methylophilus sp.]|nr:hypothetical protein [Methylophilus sp.]